MFIIQFPFQKEFIFFVGSLFLFCRRMCYSKKEYVKEYVKKQQWVATATSSLLSYVCESFYNFSSIWQNSMDMFTIPETYGNFER